MEVPKKVTIDCPVCSSGNAFQAPSFAVQIECEDCGFVLSDTSPVDKINCERCIFCGNDRFYIESLSLLAFFNKSSICYICEAKYESTIFSNTDGSFSDETARRLSGTEIAAKWKERIEYY